MSAQRLVEQFETLEKQDHAARLAMWMFLGSETLLFGALFAAYAYYRAMYPAGFVQALHHNSVALGTTNTVVLITSSFTVALGVHFIRENKARLAAGLLALSTAFGAVFLVVKGFEYAHHIHENALPAGMYSFVEQPPAGVVLGYTLYWFMTALHGLHVIAGMIMLAAVAVLCLKGRYGTHRYVAVENVGLYWHLVDVVWIFLWPLFYLTD
ncbi:cytochrome c oxidase subunit 3 [Polyangium jinanense]|nr:cytochrome c oxidase subunit 3 [Polyangium jinanense]